MEVNEKSYVYSVDVQTQAVALLTLLPRALPTTQAEFARHHEGLGDRLPRGRERIPPCKTLKTLRARERE